jgi:recombination protein RecA
VSKADPVKAVLEGILKRAGKGAAQLLSEGADSDIEEVVATGIDVLDHHVLGIGGWPLGRIVELFASEGDGKTSLLLQTIAGVQREGGVAVLVETEHAMDSARAQVFGCDLERVILSQPDTLEEALQTMEAALESLPNTKKGDPPNFVGWDSLAATPTKREVTEGLDFKAAMGDRAKMMSTAMRTLTRLVTEKRALLMIVNQTRTKLGVMFGPNKTTPGGDALKFHASVRLEMFSGKSVKDGTDHVGKQVTMMATKTKVGGKPWAKAKVRLYYDTGWANPWSTINLAKDRKLIEKDARQTDENYASALKALGAWPRGFAAGHGGGDVESGLDEDD